MKRVTLLTTAALFAATAAWSYIHMDDFQSYDDGDDIAVVGPWTQFGNPIYCLDLGGDEKVATYVGGETYYWIHQWDESDSMADFGASFDFYLADDGGDPKVSIFARAAGTVSYVLGIRPCRDEPRIVVQYWVPGNHTDLWETTLDEPIPVEEWHNLKYYVHDEDPVNFQVYFDDEKIGSHSESVYIIPSGKIAIAGLDSPYDVYVDNVMQLEENTSVAPASLGEVKAVFK
ncbi:MAG: hypothetical protein JSW52_04890 [Candidatus Coatesbacteria bacterium]|nr:MAG: hypothetical protein JSW52_04890 [Candidatus Coatesbacteria bacterium]